MPGTFGTYARKPKVRATPPAGPAIVYDMTTYQWVISAEPEPIPVLFEKELITFDRKSTRYGFQLDATIDLLLAPDSTEDLALRDLWDRMLRDDHTLELSLSRVGDADNYRAGYFDVWQRTIPEGKRLGAQYHLHWKCEAMIRQLPAGDMIGPGAMTAW